MKSRPLSLVFPTAGLDRRAPFWAQPPFSTASCLNVRADDAREGRERGGSRPGLGKAYQEVLGSGNPVRLLAHVTVLKTDKLDYWADDFSGDALSGVWSTASWIGTAVPLIDAGHDVVTMTEASGAVRSVLANFDTADAYQIEIFIVPFEGSHHGSYSIFGRMNDTTPVATTDGFVATLTMTDGTGAFSGSLTAYSGGTPTAYTFTPGTTSYPAGGWFKVLVTGTNVKCYWEGNLLKSQNISLGAGAGTRFGFGLSCANAGGVCLADTFRIQYYRNDTKETRRNVLVASSNGELWREARIGEMSKLTTDLTLASDRMLMSAERAQKLYLADIGAPRISGTGGTVDAAGVVLDDAAVSDWTAHGIDPDDDVVSISAGTGSVVNGTYRITSVHATNGVTLTDNAGVGGGNCTYRIVRGAKVYDASADTFALWWPTTGAIPTDCELVCRYRDRLVLAGGHLWYMTRQGDPLDFDYGQTDAMAAVAGTTADAGMIGERLTALIPYGDDFLVFGCEQSLWMLRGDPAFGGSIDDLSSSLGIVDKKAWCRGPNGELVFLSLSGLAGIALGGGAPQLLSGVLPDELRNVDRTLYSVALEYDPTDEGIHIFLTPVAAGSVQHWWYDWNGKGFWPVSIPSASEPFSIVQHAATAAEESSVLLGGRDGYIRRFRPEHETDEGTEIASHLFYGPFRPGGEDMRAGRIDELVATLAAGSGDVTWGALMGETVEEAFVASAHGTGTWSAGLNRKARPRSSGSAGYIKLENADADRAWSAEKIAAVFWTGGKERKP